jgi:hypothetical protein
MWQSCIRRINILIDWFTLSYSVCSFVISGLKIIGHGNPDNNLESLYILKGFDDGV